MNHTHEKYNLFHKNLLYFCLFSVSKNVTEKVKSPYCQKVILKFWRNTNNTSLLKTKEKKKKRKKSELSSMRFLKGSNHYNIYLQHSILLAQIRERTLHFTYNITNTYSLSTFDRSRFCYIFLFCLSYLTHNNEYIKVRNQMISM